MSTGEQSLAERCADIKARTPLASLVGRRVKLTRSGREWTGCCPFHSEHTPSFHVYPDHFHCFGCGAHGDAIDFAMKIHGASFKEAIGILSDEAGIDAAMRITATPPKSAPPAEKEADQLQRLELAWTLFMDAVDPRGTAVESYLISRGLSLPRAKLFRFHPACPRGPAGGGEPGERLPAMMAAMTDPVTGRFAGVHRTFLRADGRGKIEQGRPKMMLGGAGVIRLAPDEHVTLGLGICEGIETGLALIQRSGWSAMWAAGNAVAIGKFPVMQGVECLTIFPDLDDKGAGRTASEACASRWLAAGKEVQMAWPPTGKDWHDSLIGEET